MNRSREPHGQSIAKGEGPFGSPAAAPASADGGVPLLAAFTASGCLFLLELFAGRLLLPRFGGAPAVWVTCLAFFQAGLVTAYWVADRLTSLLQPGRQMAAVAVLFAAAAAATAACIGGDAAAAVPAQLFRPVAVVLALAATVGPAFFALATLAPIFGHWAGLDTAARRRGGDGDVSGPGLRRRRRRVVQRSRRSALLRRPPRTAPGYRRRRSGGSVVAGTRARRVA